MSAPRHWIAVASADHVRLGRAGGFMQVCHGKRAPLARMQPGDGIVYYSPTISFRGGDRLRRFTAHGIVAPGAPYQIDIGGGFRPFRRDVAWLAGDEVPIESLLDELEFASGRRNWAYPFRFGLFGIPAHDFRRIAETMTSGSQHPALASTGAPRGTETRPTV